MTRPWTVFAAANSRYHLLYCGESIGCPGYTDCVKANAECDRRNQKAEAWRVLRAKEIREAKK